MAPVGPEQAQERVQLERVRAQPARARERGRAQLEPVQEPEQAQGQEPEPEPVRVQEPGRTESVDPDSQTGAQSMPRWCECSSPPEDWYRPYPVHLCVPTGLRQFGSDRIRHQ